MDLFTDYSWRAELRDALAKLAGQNVYIGTSSWKYPGWCGRLYDRDRYTWRNRFSGYFREIGKIYPPKEDVDYDALGDMVNSVVEGGLILSRAYDDPKVLAGQIMQLRQYVRLLFLPNVH